MATGTFSTDKTKVLAQLRGGTNTNVLRNLHQEQRVEQQTLDGATADRRACYGVQIHRRAEDRPPGKLELKLNLGGSLPIYFRTLKNRSRLCYYDSYNLKDST